MPQDIRDERVHRLLEMLKRVALEHLCSVIEPPSLEGKSGTTHTFSFLVVSGGRYCGLDLYEVASEVDVLRSYVKKLDTGASCFLVTVENEKNEEAQKMAAEYGIDLFTINEVELIVESKKAAIIKAVMSH